MSQAARLFARGQAAHASQFPATIEIAGEEYTAATSGEKRERDLMGGGYTQKREIAFWLPVAAFATADQPLPVERSSVTLVTQNGVEIGRQYVIANISTDPTGTTITLKCESPDQ
jgi:hypothetical protein